MTSRQRNISSNTAESESPSVSRLSTQPKQVEGEFFSSRKSKKKKKDEEKETKRKMKWGREEKEIKIIFPCSLRKDESFVLWGGAF